MRSLRSPLPAITHALLSTLLLSGAAGWAATLDPLPDCDRLQGWAAKLDPQQQVSLAPKVRVPNLLADELTVPLFGHSALTWDA
jgi:hypothetical protein